MAVVPSIGRADRAVPPEADLTRALYERYASQIFRYCLHQLGSREEAEDAVQSTFLNAFRGIKRGIVPELESAWLFKIAENVCLSRRRSAWRRNRIESPTDFDVVEELAPAPSRLADELVGLQDVLEQMPESQRRAILLREWQGLSYREIAAELSSRRRRWRRSSSARAARSRRAFRSRRHLRRSGAWRAGPTSATCSPGSSRSSSAAERRQRRWPRWLPSSAPLRSSPRRRHGITPGRMRRLCPRLPLRLPPCRLPGSRPSSAHLRPCAQRRGRPPASRRLTLCPPARPRRQSRTRSCRRRLRPPRLQMLPQMRRRSR